MSEASGKITHFEICRFIRDISLKLNLLPKVTCSALQIYHHVYDYTEFATFEEISPYNVATSCVWLASKESEVLIRLRDLVNVVYCTTNNTDTPLTLSDQFYDLRDSIGNLELLILRVLNFHVPKPEFFDLTCHYLYVIEKWFHGRPTSDNHAPVTIFKAVAKSAVSFLMDSLHRPEIIHFEQKAVALACIDLALKVHGAQIPLDDFCEKSWRKAICPDIEYATVKKIQETLSLVYEEDEPKWKSVV